MLNMCRTVALTTLLVWLGLVVMVANASKPSCAALQTAQIPLFTKCKYLIVGGGPGGLYSAYQMRKLGKDVCVVEKEAVYGGKMQDVPGVDPDPTDNVPPKEFGTCGLRINENQPEMRCLAYELGVSLEESPFETAYYTRGSWMKSSAEFIKDKKFNLTFQPDVEDPEIDLYMYAMLGMRESNPLTGVVPAESPLKQCIYHPNVNSYLRTVLGAEAFDFLQAANNFRGDFNVPMDVCNYIAFSQVEATRCCKTFYIAGGFESLWNAVKAKAAKAGVRFFSGAEAKCVVKHGNPKAGALKYQVVTGRGQGFLASRVILAVPSGDALKLTGNIATGIAKSAFIQSVLPQETVYYNAFYPRRFWEEHNGNGINPTLPGYSFRVITDGQCTVRSEYPRFEWIMDTNASRPIYVDDPECMEEWKAAYATGGLDRVTELVEISLRAQFPGVDIPKPSVAYFFNKKASWAHIKPYSMRDHGITPKTMIAWAADPLPGEQICMVGENYQIEYTAWSHGAVLSSIACLTQHFADVVPLANITYHHTCGGVQAPFPTEKLLPDPAGHRRSMAERNGGRLPPMHFWKR